MNEQNRQEPQKRNTAKYAVGGIATIFVLIWVVSLFNSDDGGQDSLTGASPEIGVWATTTDSKSTTSTPPVTAEEQAALRVAYPGDLDPASIDNLREMCSESGADKWDYGATSGFSAEQANEIRGMLMLCPNHSDAALLRRYLALTEKNAKLRASGRIFDTGETYLVGSQIRPGTYVASNAKDCYWERTDKNGNVIDNNFSHGAARVQVTIRGSDYAFNSEQCGEWSPA